ncbi:hypothetical protein ABZW11_26440 [Nonomuraea sp. NPDC004580]|uniref:hypothetical protein n=1 Tax=Nonomuraea sp. NPDC004580 TaxID=3154552 RepID=UPI0033BA87CD
MTRRRTITCADCGKPGLNHARNLDGVCYSRHQRRGTLDQFPRTAGTAEPWQPARSDGQRMMDRYRALAQLRPPMSKRAIAWELGVSERSVERYAAALRAQQADQAPTRTEAA